MEEYPEGEEVSLLAIVSGEQVLPLAPAQDYKRALDGDEGPKYGGQWGPTRPVPAVDDALYAHLVDEAVPAHGCRTGEARHRIQRCPVCRSDVDREDRS